MDRVEGKAFFVKRKNEIVARKKSTYNWKQTRLQTPDHYTIGFIRQKLDRKTDHQIVYIFIGKYQFGLQKSVLYNAVSLV